MSDSESDSDSGFDTVHLGLVDVPISKKEFPTLVDSFIGGSPIWIDNVAPPKEYVTCDNCSEPLALLLQCNNLNNDSQRVIYVTGCRNYRCGRKNGSIKAFKAIKVLQAAEKQPEPEEKVDFATLASASNPFASSLKANPFGASDAKTNPFDSSAGPFSAPFGETSPAKSKTKSYASVASKNKDPVAKYSPSDISLPSFPGYILYIIKEKLRPELEILPPLPENLKIEEVIEGDDDAGSIKDFKETMPQNFDSDVLNDRDFQGFTKRVAHNPLQVLRIGGSQLRYSSKSKEFVLPPKPEFNPSSERCFELQLMPKAIIDLELELDNIAEGMEWGTISVFTDLEDYVPKEKIHNNVGYVKEWVYIEWEDPIDYSQIKK